MRRLPAGHPSDSRKPSALAVVTAAWAVAATAIAVLAYLAAKTTTNSGSRTTTLSPGRRAAT